MTSTTDDLKHCIFCDGTDAQHRGAMLSGKWICVHCLHNFYDLLKPVSETG